MIREELGKDEEVVARLQSSKVMSHRDNPKNIPRRCVGAFWVIFWFVLALIFLTLWLLRLLGIVRPPWM